MFKPRESTLLPEEIDIFFRALDDVGAMGTMKMELKLVLLTLVRKSAFTYVTWTEMEMDMDDPG